MAILLAWLLADFVTGIVHWAQDKLLNESTFKFLNRVKADNELHHERPAAMLRGSWWENIDTSAPFLWPLGIVLIAAGCPPVVYLTVFFASIANIIHRFAHTPKAQLSMPVRLIQTTGLFISFDHHAKHHYDANGVIKKENTTIRYCPMTNWLNPILDALHFFQFLEMAVRRTWRLK